MKNKDLYIIFSIIILVGIIAVSLLNYTYFYPVLDEIPHFTQVMKFMNKDYTILYYLTVIPGYHLTITTFMKLFRIYTLDSARYMVFFLNILLLIPLIYILTKKDKIKTMQFFIFPIFFVYYFLIYTDMFSMAIVLFTYYFIMERKYCLASLSFFVSILMRQNNFLWIGLWGCLILQNDMYITKIRDVVILYKNNLLKGMIRIFLERIWMFIFPVIFFIMFFVINKGLVVGDRGNQFFGIFFNNIWIFFFTIFMFFWPLLLSNIKNIRITFKEWGIIAGIFIFYLGSLGQLHLYNIFDKIIRNRLLQFAISNPLNQIIFFIGVLGGILIIWKCIEFHNKWLFMFFGLLLLIPSWLVEWRYYFIPLAFILIYRNLYEKKIEFMMSIYWICMSIIFLYGLLASKMFI